MGAQLSCMLFLLVYFILEEKTRTARNALVAFLSLCLQMPRRWNNHRSMVDMVLILGDDMSFLKHRHQHVPPRCSMYGIFTYIYHENSPNV